MPGYVFTLFALGLDVPGIRSTLGAVCIFTLVLYPYVYLLARAAFLSQSRTLLEAARGLGPLARAGDPARGAAARAAGDPRRRGARADGGARRLRHREPARRADVHRRDLPRLVQRLRPRGGDAVRDAAGVGHAHRCSCSSAWRAGRARHAQRRVARRPGAAGAPARPGGRWRRWSCRSRWWGWWCSRRSPSSASGRCSRSARACWRPSSPPPRATACCSPAMSAMLVPVVALVLAYGVRASRSRARRGGGAHRYDRLRPAGLRRGGGGDRAARLARAAHRRGGRARDCCSRAP